MEEIRILESQNSSFKQEMMNLNDQLEQMYQTRLDKDELNRTKEDNRYLEQQLEMAQAEHKGVQQQMQAQFDLLMS